MSYLFFLRENARWLAGGFLLCFLSSFGQTFFIALSGGEIRATFDLSNGEFGSLYMVATLASALTLPQLGRIVDHLSVARTILIVMPLLALACLMMSTVTSVLLLGLTLYLLRLFGQGMMTHISITAMGRWYFGHRGRAVSLATLGHQTGEGLLPILMVSLFAILGWRTSWMFWSGFLVLIALPIVYLLMRVERMPRSTDLPEKRRSSRDWTRGDVVRDPLFWAMLMGVLASPFIGTTIFFHQAYLVELRGWEREIFASAFIVMSIMTIVFALICGFLIDRFGSPRILPVYLLPLSAACISLAVIESETGIFVFMALLGISYGFASTLFGALWPEIYGTRYLGGIRSITVALMVLATAMGPGVTGVMIDLEIPYPAQIIAMGFYCLAAAIIMLFVSRKLVARTSEGTS